MKFRSQLILTMKPNPILLTGASGILGSHILFELLRKSLENENLKIYVMIRTSKSIPAQNRLEKILTSDALPAYLQKYTSDKLLKNIRLIDCDLDFFTAKCLGNDAKFDIIHAAALVDLSCSESTEQKIRKCNFEGSKKLLEQLADKAASFVYVSTAYSSGRRNGIIDNDYLSLQQFDFRNHYEKYKSDTEFFVKDFCEKHNIKWQIMRPSIICGRLFEEPLYVIPRFMVFYLFARFLLLMRDRIQGQNIRLFVPHNSAINIVPVDYCAKVILETMGTEISQLNIVAPDNLSVRTLFETGFKAFEFEDYEFVEEPVVNPTQIEKMLLSTIGEHLGPYIDNSEYEFDIALLKSVLPVKGFPSIAENFISLLFFAVLQNFRQLY